MQSQPFVLDHLNKQRQADLHAASLDVRSVKVSKHSFSRSSRVARLLALVSRRPSFPARTGSTGVQPAAGR